MLINHHITLSKYKYKADKSMIPFANGAHQLYLEIPPIREKAMKETLSFLLARI